MRKKFPLFFYPRETDTLGGREGGGGLCSPRFARTINRRRRREDLLFKNASGGGGTLTGGTV